MHTVNRENHSHTNSTVSSQVYVHDLLVQHLYSVFFPYMDWYGPISETAWIDEKAEKLIKIYRFYRAEEDNQ